MHRWIPALAVVVAMAFTLPAATAADDMTGHIMVTKVWTKATITRNGAAYATIENHGDDMDRLVAVETDAAERAEIHTHLMEDGIMKMRKLKAIELHPGAPTVLKPGGHHLMLFGMKRKWKEGEMMPLTLVFEKAGRVEVQAHVKAWGDNDNAPDTKEHDHSSREHDQGS